MNNCIYLQISWCCIYMAVTSSCGLETKLQQVRLCHAHLLLLLLRCLLLWFLGWDLSPGSWWGHSLTFSLSLPLSRKLSSLQIYGFYLFWSVFSCKYSTANSIILSGCITPRFTLNIFLHINAGLLRIFLITSSMSNPLLLQVYTIQFFSLSWSSPILKGQENKVFASLLLPRFSVD